MDFFKNIGVGCHSFLRGIFPTQGLNPALLHCRHLSHRGSPYVSLGLRKHQRRFGWSVYRLWTTPCLLPQAPRWPKDRHPPSALSVCLSPAFLPTHVSRLDSWWLHYILCWQKDSLGFFHHIVWEDVNKFLGQPIKSDEGMSTGYQFFVTRLKRATKKRKPI